MTVTTCEHASPDQPSAKKSMPAKNMMQPMDALRERGLFHQSTDDESDEKPLAKLFSSKRVTLYSGFDPTAPSLTIGNLVPTMMMAHLQRAGHRPIALVGGGTGLVGDPSGKTEMRQLLATDDVERNLEAQKEQLGRYLDLSGDPEADDQCGFVVNNADWLVELNYIEFLREIGRHFSVNRMLAAESVKQRIESASGLSFLEFNYSLLQAYDFLVLSRRYGCELQVGGGDQWGNIVAGIDLIRRADGRRAHALTAPLLTTASGQKMGKTEKGSVWLDATRTSPYDFYQYWINCDDRDVIRLLRTFTFLPFEEIAAFEELEGADLRQAKEVLAYETTSLAHGEEEAKKARAGARSLFGGGVAETKGAPSFDVESARIDAGIGVLELAAEAALCESRNAARRLARQGGLYVNGNAVAEDYTVTAADLEDGAVLLRAGKKRYLRITLSQ